MNTPLMSLKPNCYQTALAEAAFLTGLERNSDVVAMSSYAPLFSLSEAEQWTHNLINFNPAHILLTTNFYVQRMFGTTVGNSVVEFHGNLPSGVFGSATVTQDRLIIKLVNTNPAPFSCQIHLDGIPDGRAQVEYLQSDDLNACNRMTFHGKPEYAICPKTMELQVQNSCADLPLEPYGFYVLLVNR
jgi:alpha-L-arabinofuranosidase